LIDCLYLIKNGVPFDVAFSLPACDRLLWIVALGELDGFEYDWSRRQWRQSRDGSAM
jgi:hypothetical protein